jgi:hypothetical protein
MKRTGLAPPLTVPLLTAAEVRDCLPLAWTPLLPPGSADEGAEGDGAQ